MMNDSTLYIDWMALQLAFRTDGRVVRVPGMPPMYDHEYFPQDVGFRASSALSIVLMIIQFPLPEDVGVHVFPSVFE